MADGQGSPARPEGSGPSSGTQICVSAGVLVGRLTDGDGEEALGDGAADGDGPIGTTLGAIAVVGLGDGTGVAHPARSAQSVAMAINFIVRQTVRVQDRLRKGFRSDSAHWPSPTSRVAPEDPRHRRLGRDIPDARFAPAAGSHSTHARDHARGQIETKWRRLKGAPPFPVMVASTSLVMGRRRTSRRSGSCRRGPNRPCLQRLSGSTAAASRRNRPRRYRMGCSRRPGRGRARD